MHICTKMLVLGAVISCAAYAQAQQTTIAQWGVPGRAGDIVTATQFFVPPPGAPEAWTTHTAGNEVNPVVGADYYPNNTDRTPVFNVAVSGQPNTGQLDVFQPGNPDVTNDQIRIAVNDAEPQVTGMISFENLLSGTTDPLATFSAERYQFQGTSDGGEMRFLFQASNDSWYVSDPGDSLPGGFEVQEITNVPAANWYEFTPFSGGVSSIAGSPAAGLDFANVQAVGAYWDIAKNSGSNAMFSLGYLQATTGTVVMPSNLGDFDASGAVGNGDLTLLLDSWGGAPDAGWVSNPPASVGNASLTELLDNWGNDYAGATLNAVPEPCSAILFAGMIGLAGLRRTRLIASA